MRSGRFCFQVVLPAALTTLSVPASAQITSNEGDGVLNAPYRGTVDALRECAMDLGYGEVKSHTEPLYGTLEITSSMIDVWVEGDWDRSVLRLFQGIDACGDEVDLSGTSESAPATLSAGSDGFVRFSLKAIGTKTLAPQTYTIKFFYRLSTTWTTVTRSFRVAPMTGTNCSLPGESEAFHFGTPLLAVSVGNATLTVPVGRTAEMIGAAFIDKDNQLGPSTIQTTDVLLPGAAESQYIQNLSQFKLGGSSSGPNKTGYGTPWPGHLIGYYASGDVWGPDGTHFDSLTSTSSDFRRFDRIRPLELSESHSATVNYVYDDSSNNRVIEINDQAATPKAITLQRTAGVVTRITTSDGRGWNVQSDPVEGWITGLVPDGGQGARYLTYTPAPPDPDVPRVIQVKDGENNVMYEFEYQFDGDAVPVELTGERRFVDGNLETVIEHEIVSESLRRRKEYVEPEEFRQYDFAYDAGATPNPLKHRLASITSYSEHNGGGTSYTTTYTHDVDNADGTMVITQVDLPDGTWINHEYDSHIDTQTVHFGFRTKNTHAGPDDGSLVTYDVDYEFFYSASGLRLFHQPRIVKERDGRHNLGVFETETTYDYEDGTWPPQAPYRLMSVTGPAVTLGPSAPRTPETRFGYDPSDKVLTRQETDYDAGTNGFRVIEFGHDELLRLTSETVDPDDKILVTQYLYCDTQPTQDRIVIDPDGYWMRTRYDNDGRVATVERFLNADAGTVGQPCTDPSGPFYGTTYVYDTNGRLDQRIVDHKDQDGADLVPATITTQYTYDRLGRLTLQTLDPGGIAQEANFDYNWLGEIEREFDTSGRGTKRVYDERGLVESETPLALGEAPDTDLTTTFEYDAVGNRTFTYPPTHPAGPHEERVYDDFSRLEDIKRHPGTHGGNPITTTFEYDEANNVTRTVVEEDGVGILSDATTEFDEGGFNYESRQRADAGTNGVDDVVTERSYDWAGNVTEERTLGDATVAHRVITTIYDGANRVERVQDSEGGETVYDRDKRGNVTQTDVKLDGSDYAVTNTEYDALSRPITITDPEDGQDLRHYRERRCDSRGNLRRETMRHASDTPKMTIVFAYDNAGRRTRRAVLADAGAITTPAADADPAVDRVVDFEYDADGRLLFRKTYNDDSPTALETATIYDDLGRVDVVTDPSGGYADDDYFANGRLEKRVTSDGLGTRTFTFGYDGHDRVTQQTATGTGGDEDLVSIFGLDGLDRQVLVTDPKDIKTKTEYDLVGRRSTAIEDYAGQLPRQTDFTYNRLSQLIEQTAQNKDNSGGSLDAQTTTYRYDTLGRLRRTVCPDSGEHANPEACSDCVRMEYDLGGRMTQRQDQRGLLTTLAYDDCGLLLTRTTQIDVDTFVDTFEYDALGRLKLAERGIPADPDPILVSRSEMDYTNLGDLEYETQTIAGDNTPKMVDYGYDQAGNRTQLTYPGGVMLGYTPTPLNLVESMTIGGQPLATYLYYEPTAGKPGRLLDTRTTTTDDPGGETSYEYDVDYDSHRRANAITNRVHTPARGTETIAAYTFTHDNNGNPLSQSVITGLDDFVADDRVFTVDSLNRLTSTEYLESMEIESTTLDLIGNRESHTNRAGETLSYALANPANEYATISGHSVGYDEAGNLSLDEAGRQYLYDEHNRLIEIQDSGKATLANYTYDALGRRITFEDPVAGITTRYYYDGQRVIEERDETDALLRYHVNGAQYIDERVATFEVARDGFTYYLPNRNFSIAGTGDAAGSVIDRLDYSAGGDFGGPAAGYLFDADGDEDVDLNDYADFYPCLSGPDVDAGAACALHDFDGDDDVDLPDFDRLQRCFTGDGPAPPTVCLRSVAYYHDFDGDRDVDVDDYETGFYPCLEAEEPDARCLAIHDFDTDGLSDGSVDMADYGGFEDCSANGSNQAPPESCLRSGFQDTPPAAGTFALHGRPVDVLSDDHVVQYSRARYYEPEHGRWLQRDPTGYTDGGNLYESFAGNSVTNTDPMGQQVFDPTRVGFFGASPEEVRRAQAAAGAAWVATLYGATELEAQQLAESIYHPKQYIIRPADFALGSKRLALVLLGGDAATADPWILNCRLEEEIRHLGGGLLLLGATFSPAQDSILRLAAPDLHAEFAAGERLELGVLGPLQGTAFAVEGVLDIGVGLGNLTLDVSLIRPIALNIDPGLDLAIPRARFAEGLFLETSPRTAAASRFLGGESVVFLATVGLGEIRVAGRARGTSALSPGTELRRQYGAQFEEYMRFRNQGFTAPQAKYLTQPYVGRGHHVVGFRHRLPRFIAESPLNVMKPRGISVGRFYERHFLADPYFYGAKFPTPIGGAWSGRTVGLQKPGRLGRVWYGSPRALKVAAGASAATGGAASYWVFIYEEP